LQYLVSTGRPAFAPFTAALRGRLRQISADGVASLLFVWTKTAPP
jgi:hypothetical protein